MTRRPRRSRGARKAKRTAARKPAKPVTARPADPLDGFIAAGARSLGLKIEKSWLPAVRMNLQVTLRHGGALAEFSLPDDSEPAPVFRA